MNRHLIICAFISLCICQPVNAESPPIPKDKTQALDTFKAQLERENEEKLALQKKVAAISDDLSSTKNQMIEIASAVQKNESDLKNFEQRIANLEIKKSVLQDNLDADRSSVSKLLLALIRIRRTPPEAMLAQPDTPYKTAQSALLMADIVPSISRHASALNKNLETLNRVTTELDKEKIKLAKKSDDLQKRHEELSVLLEKRQSLYTSMNNDINTREITIQKISLQAKNLEDLVKRIQEDEKKEQARKKIAKATPPPPPKNIITKSSEVRLPISGIIRTSYDQIDEVGAKSHGLTIEGRADGLVVAPIDGKIQFTGAFKRYGNIVIIEHADGYHSLIAGLDKINSVVGDSVKSGEPIGLLPNSSLIIRPTLYYELRKNGKPINPAVKFSDLG